MAERWLEHRYLSICWRNPESSTRRCKYHFICFYFSPFITFLCSNFQRNLKHLCFVGEQGHRGYISTQWLRSACNGLSHSVTFIYPFGTGDIWLQSGLQSLCLFLLSGVWGSDQVKCRGRPIPCLIKDCFLAIGTSNTACSISLGKRPTGQTGFKLVGNIVCSHFSLASCQTRLIRVIVNAVNPHLVLDYMLNVS